MKRIRKFFRTVWRVITAPFRAIGRFFKRVFQPVADFFREEPEDTPLADVLETSFSNPGAILSHLVALRKHLFRAVAAFLITSIVSFIFVTDLVTWTWIAIVIYFTVWALTWILMLYIVGLKNDEDSRIDKVYYC